MKLTDAMNTYNPALLSIIMKGYTLSLIPSKDDDELGDWYATKDGDEFYASDPLRLLALISIYEIRGDSWEKKQNEENLYDHIIDQAFENE